MYKRPRLSNFQEKIPEVGSDRKAERIGDPGNTQLEIHNLLSEAKKVGGVSHHGALGTSSGKT